VRIALVGDVHGERKRLARSLQLVSDRRIDLLLLVGDIGADPPWPDALRRSHRASHDESVREVIAHAADACSCPVVFVPGNHDLPDPAPDVRGTNADRRVVEVAGLRIAGLGGAGPARFGFPYEWSEEEAETALQPLFEGAAGSVDIFLSHTPPAGTLDRTSRGASVGSTAVARCVERAAPGLFVCGHIHESCGVASLAGVPCVNAGALGEPDAREIAWVVEWVGRPRRIRSFGKECERVFDLEQV
jgi:Icc-related predicted phosphoesterase